MRKRVFFWDNVEVLDVIIPLLRAGEVIATTTDTVPGLLAAVTQEGVSKLDHIKNRTKKPYLILIQSVQRVAQFAEINKALQVENLMKKCWPGPLTLILPAKLGVPGYVQGAGGTVALRVPKHKGLQELLRHVGALFSTSANVAGRPVPKFITTIDESITVQVACLVDDKEQKKINHKPSTILDCTGDTIRVVREGAYSIAALEKTYGSKFS